MKNLIPISIVVSIFLFAVAIGIILQVNQGHYFVEAAVKDGHSEETANLMYFNSNIAKSVSALLLLGFFFIGVNTLKRLYQKSQLKLALPYIILYTLCYAALCTAIHQLLTPIFGYSIFSSASQEYQLPSAILTALLYSGIGLTVLLFSCTYVVLTYSKRFKGLSINILGSRFRLVNFSVNLFLLLCIYLLRNQPFSISLATIYFLFIFLITSIITSTVGTLVLLSFLNNGAISLKNPLERFSQALLSSIGMFALGFIVFALALSFDASLVNTIERFPNILIAVLIATAISGSIAIALWKYNIAGVRTEAALSTAKSELSFLKSQINPHFLFNSLNSIYGIALAEKSPKTADGVQKLSEMMRFMLKENTQEKISLNKEIEYIHNYIDLQSLRLDTNKHVQLNVSIEQPCDGNISPMLLIPMIENAFKHGVSIDKPSFIDISLKCNEHYVSLNVKNSNHHKEKTAAEESGIGLENVRKRLELLYPEKHLFQVYENEETYEAFIKIELA